MANIQPPVNGKWRVLCPITSSISRWLTIPGPSGIVENNNPADVNTVPLLESTPQWSGKAKPSTVSITMGAYNPLCVQIKTIRDALLNGTVLQHMFIYEGSVFIREADDISDRAGAITIGTGNDADVATLTQTGTDKVDFLDDEFGTGQLIRIGTTYYTIRSRLTSDTMVVLNEDYSVPTAVAASKFSILRPQLRRGPFAGTVSSADATSIDSGSPLNSTIDLAPVGILPAITRDPDWDPQVT